MAYVPGFEWDIFISYPRESDQRDAQDFAWVSEFYRILENELNERLPDRDGPKIYCDRRQFAASHDLKGDLLDACRKSALFMPIVSPRFVAPGKFTLTELETFCASGDVGRRIVTIELLPVEEGRPAALQGPKRNNFFAREDGRPIKLTPVSKKYGDQYATQLQIVAEDIKDILQEMRRNAGVNVKLGTKPFAGKAVLLAEMEEDVAGEWESVRSMLRDFGATVLPDSGAYPADQDEFQAGLANDLGRADLMVQLLSPFDEANHWVELAGKPSRAWLQYAAATQASRSIPLLQWRKPIAPLRPEALKHWDKELMEGPNVAALGLEEFKREIKKKLLEAAAPAPPPVAAGAKPYVFITADDPDLGFALEFKEVAESKLRLSENCEIIAAKNRMKNFRQTIKVADVIVFFYGAGNPEFVNEWLSEYAKLKANGKAKPPQVEALYRAPPPKTEIRQKLRAPLGSFIPLGSEDAFTLDGVQRVFEELQRRRAGGTTAV